MEVLVSIFLKLLQMSIIASIIGIVILVIKKFLYKFISPKIIYVMWGVFLVALVIPPFIQSRTSIYNYVDISNIEEFDMQFIRNEDMESNESVPTKIENNENVEEVNISKSSQDNIAFNFKYVVSIVWILGVFVLLLIYLITNIVFKIKIGKNIFEDERIQSILEFSKEKIKVRKKIMLIEQKLVKTPAIIGIIKPKILLTENIKAHTDTEIEYIFRHELSHYKRKDNVINSVLIVLRSVHWFNPAVWIIMREIRKDMELTADEKAVKDLELDDRKEYCKLLVNLASDCSTTFMEKAIGITDDKNNLEKRIHMIKLSDKVSKHPVFATSLVFVIIGLICLILYTNNYYFPELEVPPKLYLEDRNGKVVEMALVEYNWLYNNEFKTYNAEFDPVKYDLKKENTICKITPDYEDMEYSVFTSPKYRMNFLKKADYKKYAEYERYRKSVYGIVGVRGEKLDNKSSLIHISDDITEIIVNFPNKSTAKYVVNNMCFDFCEEEIFDKYSNTSITDINKIEELVKTMSLSEFLKDLKIENNTLYLNYDYAQDTRIVSDMCLVLFVNIPELEKVVYTTNQKNVRQCDDNRWEKIVYDGTKPLEITKEVANKYGSMTIEELQMILSER